MAHRNKEGVTSRAETNTDLAAKLKADADDPDEVRNALDDAAGMSRNLWLAFLTFGTYIVVAVGSVKHRDLFLETPITLPALNVELPLVAFFYVAPLLFLIFHVYLLLNLRLMVDNVRRYNEMLESAKLEREEDDGFRLLLTNFPFVQLLAGTSDTRRGPFGKLLLFIVWITVALAPVMLLLLMQLTFLPYHDEGVTWWHRLIVIVDLVYLGVWPSIIMLADSRSRRPIFMLAGVVLTTFVIIFSVLIATFPGEPLNEVATSISKPYKLLFLGPVNEVTAKRSSPLDNTLVLPDEDFVDDETLDKMDRTRSLRGRDLRSAVLARTDLRKADFTGAVLNDADLSRGRFAYARFGCAVPQERLGCTSLLTGVLEKAQLQNASFQGSDLQGAKFTSANLQGANLQEANLQGADLTGAKLQGADLTRANLQGADLTGANLGGADLTSANLQGADLTGAKLQGADLTDVEVWLASFPVDLKSYVHDKSYVLFGA